MSTVLTTDETNSAHQSGAIWKHLFQHWPEGIPQRGIVVTMQGEQMPFKAFMITDEVLLLERTNPDPLGSRFILMGYESVATIKLIDALKESAFEGLGFEGKLKG